jgi:hypothetical protein
MPRLFLYLTNSRLVAMTTQGRRIAARREFAVSGAGIAEFEHYLAAVPKVPAHLFTDLADEDFRLDTVPHVNARDRSAVLGRKLAQIFRNTPYRYAQLQGREAEGRRDDRVIYTAVTNPEVLRPWLEVVDRLKFPLEGIYSAAVFSAAILQELDLASPHTLLVTFTPGEAMRQTYFKNNEIKFSRLTPVDLEEGQTLGTFVAEETMRTWQYLDSLRHFAPEDRLEVCFLVHASDRASVEPELREFAQMQYRVIDMEQAALRLGLKPAPLDSTAEEVLVHCFLLEQGQNHFASPELRRHAVVRRARIGLRQAAAVILAAGLGWGAFQVLQSRQGLEAGQRVERQLAELAAEHDAIVRSTPSLGVGGSTMRDTVSFYNLSIRNFPELPGFLASVSTVLSQHPAMRVTQLSWMASDDAKATPAIPSNASRIDPPVKSFSKGEGPPAAPPPQPENAAGATFAAGRYEIALLEAILRRPPDDFRGANEEAQRLAEEISRLPGMRAEVVESPLDVRSSRQIQGRHETGRDASLEARFVVRVVRDRAGAA